MLIAPSIVELLCEQDIQEAGIDPGFLKNASSYILLH